ncbi:MAG: hypothetical protein V4724_30330 [Pseudomonadota bacterium]
MITLFPHACASGADAIATPPCPSHGGRRFHGTLPMHRILQVGDYIVSDNGLFFAMLHGDGSLRVHRGIVVTESSSWTNSPAATLGADVEYRHGVPAISGDDFIMSDDAVDYVANGASTRLTDWAFDTPYHIAPHTAMRAAIALTYSTVSVPYVLVGQLRFESGARVVGAIRGSYLGTNAHSLTASFTPHDPTPNHARRILRPLRPLAGMIAY